MCTVMLRFDPGATWPLLLAAVRDEFMGRPWDAPGAHWPDQPTVIGGRDLLAGGTWMAVDTQKHAVAALLNGVHLNDLEDGQSRPTRGRLVLAALATGDRGPDVVPGVDDLSRYDGFHLLRADADAIEMWSWDGIALTSRRLEPGDHLIVNLGADRDADPLVPHFRPILSATPPPDLTARDPATAWGGWIDLLAGDGLAPTDPRGLIIEHDRDGRTYGSTSASLVGLARDGRIRYDFTATPRTPAWGRVLPDSP